MGNQSQFKEKKNKAGSPGRIRRWIAALSAITLIAITTPAAWATADDSSAPATSSAPISAASSEEAPDAHATPSESTTPTATPTDTSTPTVTPAESAEQTVAPTESATATSTPTESSSPASTDESSLQEPTASSSATATETTEPTDDANGGSLGDRVWLDENRNGIQDEGEPGVASVVLSLSTEAGETVATTTTDAQGHYLFENLSNGNYAVRLEIPEGLYFTDFITGHNPDRDSDFFAGNTPLISVDSAGTPNLSIDAGLARTSQESEPWIALFEDEPSTGDTITVEAGNFEPESTVTFEFRTNDGTNIWHTTEQRSNRNGTVKFDFTIPYDAPAGFGDIHAFDEAGHHAIRNLDIFLGADPTCESGLKASINNSNLSPGQRTHLNLTGTEPAQRIILNLINAESTPVDFMLEETVGQSQLIIASDRCNATFVIGALKTTPAGDYTLRGLTPGGKEVFAIPLSVLSEGSSPTPSTSSTTSGEPTQSTPSASAPQNEAPEPLADTGWNSLSTLGLGFVILAAGALISINPRNRRQH